MDYSFVNRRLATGAEIASVDDVALLKEAGITDIIDCRAEFDDIVYLSSYPEIGYFWNPEEDDGQPKDVFWFQKTITHSLEVLGSPHKKLYIHCAAGVNRGPSSAYAVLRALGFDSVIAENMIRSVRPQVGLAYKADADKAITELGFE